MLVAAATYLTARLISPALAETVPFLILRAGGRGDCSEPLKSSTGFDAAPVMTAKSPYLLVSHAQTNRLLPEPYQRVVIAVLALAPLCIPALSGDYLLHLHLINLCSIAVIGAVGINLLTGYCGQLSLGQASFMAIGAFTTAILSQRLRRAVLHRHSGKLLRRSGKSPYRYHAIASNRPNEDAAATMEWDCKRGDTSENRIKDLKIGFGMEYMPCGSFHANAVFFAIGALTYNPYLGFRARALGKWEHSQVQTVRWRLFQTPGKIVRHGRQMFLKISTAMFDMFAAIRERCACIMREGSI